MIIKIIMMIYKSNYFYYFYNYYDKTRTTITAVVSERSKYFNK